MPVSLILPAINPRPRAVRFPVLRSPAASGRCPPGRAIRRRNRPDWPRHPIQWSDPEEASAVVNAVAQVYMKEVVEKDQAEQAGKVAELERFYTQATNKLREKTASLQKQAEEIGSPIAEVIAQKLQAIQASY